MISKIKKPVSILLSLIMVFSMFAIVPLSASAEVGDSVPESEYLTFTAETAGSTVTLNVASGSNFQYDLNGAGLTDYYPGTEITLQNAGDYVRFCGTDTTFNYSNRVSLTGKVACSGNVMSLRLDDDGKVQGLINNCFNSMFEACTGLTSAPELPETELADYCYYRMFYGCINLTKAPALPATTLAQNCYNNMFSGCESLTELPALPATTLAERCYRYMFYGCSKICISDEAGTFDDITYSAEYRIPTTGEGTWAYDALYGMFEGTGGEFAGTPDINTTYYVPAPAPAPEPAVASVTAGGTTTEYTDFATAVTNWNSAANGATLTLLADVTTESTIEVSGTKILDLNGYELKKTGSGGVINVNGANLTLNDSNPDTVHGYTISNPNNGAGLATVHSEKQDGDTEFTGGYITGGIATDGGGGGVKIASGGRFTMNGGTVIGNTSSGGYGGGGIFVVNNNSGFTMNDGAIIGNTTTNGWGGGVNMTTDGGSFTMTGGVIEKNLSTKSSYADAHGGGSHQ